MIVIFHPGMMQGDKPGHYFSCEDCGLCSEIFHGEDSRFRAVAYAHLHALSKVQHGREYVRPNVTEIIDDHHYLARDVLPLGQR